MKIRFSLMVLLIFILIMTFSSLVCAEDFSLCLFDLAEEPEIFFGGPDEVDCGDDAEFWAMIDADVLSYQWWSDDGILTDNRLVKGSATDVLVLKNVNYEDNGTCYWCVITYVGGTVCTEKMELRVRYEDVPPEESEHRHELRLVLREEPTCVEPGQKACYVCSSCKMIFADADGKIVVSEYSELLIPATGHVFDQKKVDAVYLKTKADCKNPAQYYFSCKCGDKGENAFLYGGTSDHCFDSWIQDGDEHYRQCSVCKIIVDRKEHDWKSVESDQAYKQIYRCFCGAEKEVLSLPFDDVFPSNWFYEDVLFVYHENLIRGLKFDTFGPNVETSRAMIVTILYRMEGEPRTGNNPFTDVKSGSWYDSAVTWAAEQRLVEGYGYGKFGPNDPVTREQLAAILYRYTKYKKGNVSSVVSLKNFPDVGIVSSWAETSMSWAVAQGLISGVGKGNVAYLCPQDNALRCQIAAILNRYLN